MIKNKTYTFRSQITGRNNRSQSEEKKSIVEKGLGDKDLWEVGSNGPGAGGPREQRGSPVRLGGRQQGLERG